jgi:Flp pilus assembly protein TadG
LALHFAVNLGRSAACRKPVTWITSMTMGRDYSASLLRQRGRARRRGAVVVEFAFIAPILLAVVLGTLEIGRAIMVSEMLNTAARAGARAGTVLGATNSSVNTAISRCLTSISNSTTTIKVNGQTADVSSAIRGDAISVEVSVPYSSVSWLPHNSYLGSSTLTAAAAMDHE